MSEPTDSTGPTDRTGPTGPTGTHDPALSPLGRFVGFCLSNRLVVALAVLAAIVTGLVVAPFDWQIEALPRHPVPVDAIPDTGDNQQIVFTEWSGRSPQDVEDQVTYPLTVALLGLPGVKTIRSSSMMGFSSVFVIFDDGIEFYWSRSRILEKLASLPAGTLPDGVQPALGPDATALGQVFWYTLQGRDEQGQPAGGWDLFELRSEQDWYVRWALASVEGVAEVASVGGYVQEYQIDVDPDAMRAFGVTLEQVFAAVRASNVDVGARTIEVNRAEYVVRGLGFIEGADDLESTVVAVRENVPVTLRQIGTVALGPALRRGALDAAGAEAVGGVVVARYGANPLEVIRRVKEKIAAIEPGLRSKVLADGTESRITIVPFYDRAGLIGETLGTLEDALRLEILVTAIVVLAMVAHLGTAALISLSLPLAVLLAFGAMKLTGVDANVVALAGIAIAIGTLVDVGVVLTESILRHVHGAETAAERRAAVHRGAAEVGGAVVTAILTTVIGFLPVFALSGPEGKLFAPLAWTKTFALTGSILVGLVVLPPAAHLLYGALADRLRPVRVALVAIAVPAVIAYPGSIWSAIPIGLLVWELGAPRLSERARPHLRKGLCLALALLFAVVLAGDWSPLGPGRGVSNVVFTVGTLGGLLLAFLLLRTFYEPMLRWCLAHKALFLTLPVGVCVLGLVVWRGFDRTFGFVPDATAAVARAIGRDFEPERARASGPYSALAHAFPGLGREFMPPLDEGSFLLMPVTMAHASIGEALDLLQLQDRRVAAIPEVETVVGKIGRVESALDPAPISMVETVVQYVPEYRSDADGRLLRFAWDEERGDFRRDWEDRLVRDPDGRPFRQWRDEIESPDDIWEEVARAAEVPGMTTASKLQPIETRRIMLQTGMRSALGIKVQGPDLETIEAFALELEQLLREVPSVRPETVIADRIVGKPYLEIDIDRDAIARYGLSVRSVQDVIEVAIGGRTLTTTVEGRERYPVRVRYLRELRDQIESLDRILVAAPDGTQIPLGQLAGVRYTAGPQAIRSEDTFLVAYVLFDRVADRSEVDVVEDCEAWLADRVAAGELVVPPGVSWHFAGSYENQVRAAQTLRLVLPAALLAIFVILYLQFRSTLAALLVFSGVFVAWAGGFVLLWLWGREGFLDVELLGANLRDVLQLRTVDLSVAVWVGFLALFGIATDDGVLMTTYLRQRFREARPRSRTEIRDAVVAAALRRVRPCLMTSATTILALLPVLTSRGRGADVMIPMALPTVGGMAVVLLTIFLVPTLWSLGHELALGRRR